MSDISQKIESEIAAAGLPPVTDEQIAATVASAREALSPRYQVFTVTNYIAGPRYVVFDRQTKATIAEFLDRGHFIHAEMRFVVTERIGHDNATMFAQIMNVQDEASHGQ